MAFVASATRALIIFGLVCLLSFIGSAGLGQQKQPDLQILEGRWQVSGSEFDGEEAPKTEIEGDSWFISSNGKVIFSVKSKIDLQASFTIQPDKTPKQINFLILTGPNAGKLLLGIYKLDERNLICCVAFTGSTRPQTFSSKDKHFLFTLTKLSK